MRHFCSSAVYAALAAFALGGSVTAASAQNAYYTTGTYTIDAANSVTGSAFVGVDSGSNLKDNMGNPYNPTVNLVTGGSVGFALQAYNSSTVTVSGGSIGSGGLFALNSSAVTVSGGSVGYQLNARNSSSVLVSGGSISNGLIAINNSAVTVSGGTFGRTSFVNFYDNTTGSFTLVGSNLMAVNVGADANLGGTDYSLSGTLQSGTNLAGYQINVQPGATLFTLRNATAVPEPGSVALLVGMGVTGAGFLSRRRRHQAKNGA